MKKNFVKEKLKKNETVMGIWNTMASPNVTDVIASTGIDFVIIDFEHGPYDMGNLTKYTNACLNYNVSPLVRIPKNIDWMAQQSLDQGAQGIIAPHIHNAHDSELFTQSCYYHPKGKRGYTPYTKSGAYSHAEKSDYVNLANENNLSLALIESVEGLMNIDKITQNPLLDGVFFGSFDISQSLGIPGQTRHTKVREHIAKANEIAQKNGKFTGGYLALEVNDIDWLKSEGFNIIVYGVDSFLLKNQIQVAVNYKNQQVTQ